MFDTCAQNGKTYKGTYPTYLIQLWKLSNVVVVVFLIFLKNGSFGTNLTGAFSTSHRCQKSEFFRLKIENRAR
jgi:hypothetical protein